MRRILWWGLLCLLGGGAEGLGDSMSCTDNADCQYEECTLSGTTTSTCERPVVDGAYSANLIWKLCYRLVAVNFNPAETYLMDCASGPCVPGKYKRSYLYEYGNYVIDICEPCPKGTYASAASEATACSKCEAGTYQRTEGSTECAACGLGSYQTSTGKTICTGCEQGAYQPMTGQAGGCLKCGAGTYQSLAAQEACTVCEHGSYSTALGANSSAVCFECPSGTFSTGARGCRACSTRAPDGFYMHSECNSTHDTGMRPCTASCAPGQAVVANCTNTSDAQCGGVASCVGAAQSPSYDAGLRLPSLECEQGFYLYGFDDSGPDCRQCPLDMIGPDGFGCEACGGPLEVPYWLDQSVCVCKRPARMDARGGCVCPDGWSQGQANGTACVQCPEYGLGGVCYECGAGNYSLGRGATSCERCAEGKFRVGQDGGKCQSCGSGWYAPDPASDRCVQCSQSCDGLDGWRDGGACPGGTAVFRLCEPCDWALPEHAAWRGGGCIYECYPGYYRSAGHGCTACTTGPCPAGRMRGECTADADRTCDAECVNTTKPLLYSKWMVASDSSCPWACEDGHALRRSDYWVFVINECL